MIENQTYLDKKERQLMNLQKSLNELQESFAIKKREMNMFPDVIRKQHISRLKLYNELRDTGLRLAQLVADEKQCKMKEVFDEMGYEMADK
ncbi:LAFE_0D07228g1_1 [Lachancea fermentati]|uniref:LAFE_0D07228g1_1 n=1 Tax=Lachancea fermentati TaxID=4955 RepID=A0A1G4MBY9_LACFM|nr:LAFE_0D07228g1_1 [Lachancea fermentati]